MKNEGGGGEGTKPEEEGAAKQEGSKKKPRKVKESFINFGRQLRGLVHHEAKNLKDEEKDDTDSDENVDRWFPSSGLQLLNIYLFSFFLFK